MLDAYSAAHQGAILLDLNRKGRLQLSGRDRLDLIHRMSTNDVKRLGAGKGTQTVLTTPVGRIIDVLAVLHDGENALFITGEGRGERIRAYIQRNIFFNDQVKVADLTASTCLYGLFGAKAAELLATIAPDSAQLSDHDFVKQAEIYFIHAEALAGGGFWLLGQPEKIQALADKLLASGAVMADQAAYDLLRIEAGFPLTEHELTEAYIPLEAGLWDAVSFNKGCYTGQEIIARMESRGKLAKMLVRLTAQSPLEIGTALFEGDMPVGTLTSLAQHPDGDYLGLGFIKPAVFQENALLTSETGIPVKMLDIAGTQRGR